VKTLIVRQDATAIQRDVTEVEVREAEVGRPATGHTSKFIRVDAPFVGKTWNRNSTLKT
jgi:hypothetical protein